MLSKLQGFDMKSLTIIDQSEVVAASLVVRTACEMGSIFIRTSVTRENWETILSQHLHSGDTVIDLTFGINCIDILSWCQANQVCYINTAVEKWEDELIPDNDATWIGDGKEEKGDWTVKHKELYDRTLYARHLDIANYGFSVGGPTAVLEHGIICTLPTSPNL
jgi:homospermidine synthase